MVAEDEEARAHFEQTKSDLIDAPKLSPDLNTYWVGWHQLRNDRAHGAFGGASGIYYSAISLYCRDHEISGSNFHIFLRMIRQMDDEYLLFLDEQAPKNEDTPQ